MPDLLRRLLTKIRPVAINLGLVLFSFGVAALLAEGIVRIVAPQQLILIRPDLWQPADTVGWEHRPDIDVSINTGERTVRVITDGNGFRVGSDGPRQAEVEVLLLGDSFMEALQVEYDDTGGSLLENSLSERLDRDVAVRNAGIGGWDPDQYVLRAEELVPDGGYSLVVTALYLGNDVLEQARPYVPPRAPAWRYRFRFPRGISWGEFIDAFLRPLNDALEVRSHLFLFVKNRLQTVRMQLGLAVLHFPPHFLRSAADDGRWAVTAELCARIAALAEEEGSRSLFVLVPAPFQIDADDLASYVAGYDLDPAEIDIDLPNRRLMEELEARGVSTVDLLPVLRSAHEEGVRVYGAVDQHFTRDGHRIFADVVTPAAAAMLTGGSVPPTVPESDEPRR